MRPMCRPDPLVQFQHWFDAAVHAKALEANAMTLATVGEDGWTVHPGGAAQRPG